MKISKVKLLVSGLKGAEVSYLENKMLDGREHVEEVVKKKKAPVHADVVNAYSDLREYLLEICGYGKLPATMKDDVEVHIVSSGSDESFSLSGKLKLPGLENDKYISLTTPKITIDDDYVNFDKVIALIDIIYNEIHEFITNDKRMDDRQLIMTFAEKKGEDLSVFDDMNDEDAKEYATALLEKMGSIVLHQEDVGESKVVSMNATVEKNPKQVDLEDSINDVSEAVSF